MPRTKIVATIGPASESEDVLRAMLMAGMNVARINMSHGEHDEHRRRIERLRQIAADLKRHIAILADLQGPKLRVGDMGAGVVLEAGKTVVLTTAPLIGQPGLVPIQYAELPGVVRAGERILLDDGLLELEVRSVSGQEITCQVLTGGLLTSKKGMNLPDASLSIPAITDKDRADLAFALAQGVDWVALSFVRSAAEVRELKSLIQAAHPFDQPALVIAKIEKPQALDDIEAFVGAFPLIHPTDDHLERVLDLVAASRLTRQNIFDMALAATMLGNQVSQIYTYNARHFSKIPGISVLQP